MSFGTRLFRSGHARLHVLRRDLAGFTLLPCKTDYIRLISPNRPGCRRRHGRAEWGATMVWISVDESCHRPHSSLTCTHTHTSASTQGPLLGLRRGWRAVDFSHRFRGSPAIVGGMADHCIERPCRAAAMPLRRALSPAASWRASRVVAGGRGYMACVGKPAAQPIRPMLRFSFPAETVELLTRGLACFLLCATSSQTACVPRGGGSACGRRGAARGTGRGNNGSAARAERAAVEWVGTGTGTGTCRASTSLSRRQSDRPSSEPDIPTSTPELSNARAPHSSGPALLAPPESARQTSFPDY